MDAEQIEVRYWRRLSADKVRWKRWDDDTVVYLYDTGDTHLLESVYSKLWGALSETPQPTEQIRRDLEKSYQKANGLSWDLQEALDSLERIGLVSSAAK